MATTITILTRIGNDKILEAMAQGTNVTLSSIAYGDANGEEYVPSVEQTSLVHQLGTINELTKTFDDVEGFYYIKGILPADAPAMTMRELGLIDIDGDLIAVSVIPPTSKPALEEGLEVTMPITMGFKTSTGEVMIIEAGHSHDYPDKDWVRQYVTNRIGDIKTIYSITW